MNQPADDLRRLEQIDEVLMQALELEKEERAAFLDGACNGDAAMRREIEDLLSRNIDTAELLKNSPAAAARRKAGDQTDALQAGERVGHYQIEARIGRGGMGEVYRARDVRMGRAIALKLLPAHFTTDPERLRRFEQEARTVSALNHPNVVTIHDIGQASPEQGNLHYIVTEYVDGQTLRQRMESGALTAIEAIKIASSIASALQAAHEAGIIHRDIKPENVMLRRDGLVKVLDFGLAKLTEGKRDEGTEGLGEDDPSLAPPLRLSVSPSQTNPGTVMGTARYMSPEQAAAREVDARGDLFSLGVVLYEMVAARAPFAGESRTEILTAICQSDPPPLAEAPKPLQRIVSRALEGQRERRYQTADELLDDLKSLQQAMARRARPSQAIRRVALFVLPALLIAALGVWNWPRFRPRSSSNLPAPNMTRLVATGSVGSVAISPDGRWVAYTMGRRATANGLWLREVATGNDRELLSPAAGLEYQLLSFAPVDEGVYYVAYDPRADLRALHRVPLGGGAPRRVLEGIDSPAAFSPDGREFAFVRRDGARGQSALMAAKADGSAARTLVERRDPFKFSTTRIAWSPDGQGIAYATGTTSTERDHQVYEYSFKAGKAGKAGAERLLSKQSWRAIDGVEWLGDRRTLALLASDPVDYRECLWHLSLATDETRRLIAGLERKNDLSVTADGRTLVTVELEELQSLWIASAASLARARPLLHGKEAGRDGLAWMEGGQILYASMASGQPSIWAINSDGSRNRRFSFGNDSGPAVSPDGRAVVFCSTTNGDHIWRMDRDGGNRRQLTFGAMDVEPICSPDGQWVVYASWSESRQATLWRVPIAGGAPQQLTAASTANPSPALSPDGRWLAYYRRSPQETERKRIFVISMGPMEPARPASNGAPNKILDVPHSAYLLQWSPDGQAIDYADTREGVADLWRLPLRGGAARQLTDFKSDAISRFAWSPDGAQLIVSRVIWNLDVILLRDFQ